MNASHQRGYSSYGRALARGTGYDSPHLHFFNTCTFNYYLSFLYLFLLTLFITLMLNKKFHVAERKKQV